MSEEVSYYVPSGRFTATGLALGVGLGAVGAAVLGAVYAYVVWWNPVVYVAFLATALFGVGVGVAVYPAVRLGRIRSPLLAGALAVLAAGVGLYVSWAVWIGLVLGDVPGFEAVNAFHPAALAELVPRLAEVGVWSVRRFTPTGLALYAVWGVEALVVLGAAAVVPSIAAGEPYCEASGTWYADVYDGLCVGARDDDEVRALCEGGRVAELADLPVDGASWLAITLSGVAEPASPGALKVVRCELTTDAKGNEKTTTTTVLEKLLLRGDALAQARALPERVAAAAAPVEAQVG